LKVFASQRMPIVADERGMNELNLKKVGYL
jgi:hypothetical protein